MDRDLKYYRQNGETRAAEEMRSKYIYRMYDLSQFMKTLKQRYTQGYNRRHSRKGTLWEERYKSTLIEGRQGSLSAVGAYIDLNSVRAGIVTDPKDFFFSGYGEAVAGSAAARKGIIHIACSLNQTETNWSVAAGIYRQLLYIRGEAKGVTEAGKPTKPGFSFEQVQAVLAVDGALPLNQLLRCKVRYFTNGAVLGCKLYVNEVIKRHPLYFGSKRKTGASPMKGGNDLCTARRLRMNLIMPPAAPTTG